MLYLLESRRERDYKSVDDEDDCCESVGRDVSVSGWEHHIHACLEERGRKKILHPRRIRRVHAAECNALHQP